MPKKNSNQINQIIQAIRGFKGKPFNIKQLSTALGNSIKLSDIELLLHQMQAVNDIEKVAEGRFQMSNMSNDKEGRRSNRSA